MGEHTPTPWTIDSHSVKEMGDGIVFTSGGAHRHVNIPHVGKLEALVFDPDPTEGETRLAANARFLVDAANNHHRYKAALEAITMIAGNLTDEAIEAVGGVNDARSRALMVVTARQIAKSALAQKESE